MRVCKALVLLTVALITHGCVSSNYNLATQRQEIEFISSEKEEEIGKNVAKQVERKFEIEPDVLLQERVREVGKKIADVCDRKDIEYHFEVLAKKDEVNAFSLPGGYVFIFKGMLDKAKNDDELASILAHEVAHIAARHSIKRIQTSLGDTILRLAIAAAKTDNWTRAMANEALNQLLLSYSREDEILADKLGIKYVKLAGYNPKGAIAVIQSLIDVQRKAPLKKYYRYRTHPYLSERLSMAREEVYGKMEFRDYINLRDETLEEQKGN
ncbi:MAG: hypothetical protein COS99_07315 [Candidatus Omnitrophica bacterium CG07_land_8_20_14_0_80_42_15]|uniref:Peptidase M48 domain-containing protein n=1 Tax=Candidatus Aquitaenariimonas noxiae TaxID=1974741 RepID=A0A2J0KTM8_9BACT|nr:MAG: hypothetical protein COS99_07315 [Candidatus Omnitrophica bacterium CG07_land_8_20_14_0_80_42_15]